MRFCLGGSEMVSACILKDTKYTDITDAKILHFYNCNKCASYYVIK